MSLHQKQYQEPPAVELDVVWLRKNVVKLREALIELLEKGEGCLTGRNDCEPSCCRYGSARKVLKDTENLYFQK